MSKESNGRPRFADFPQHVEALVEAALAGADARQGVHRYLTRQGRTLSIGRHPDITTINLDRSRVFVVSAGKAAVPMARGALEVLNGEVAAAVIITAAGERDWAAETASLPAKVFQAGHPLTNQVGLDGTAAVVSMLETTQPDDVVLCLISGGTSSLLSQPLIPLPDLSKIIDLMMKSGATINELNTVRRALDPLKLGGLARLAYPAACYGLILSDVVGNPLRDIGSGPTVIAEDPVSDLVTVLGRYDLARKLAHDEWQRLAGALKHVQSYRTGSVPIIRNYIIGDVRTAATVAMVKALQLGFVGDLLTTHMEGEASTVGRLVGAMAGDIMGGHCYIMGGETTVTVRGSGQGGRNLELALAAATALRGRPRAVVATLATDGKDGSSNAAGAAVTGETVSMALAHHLNPLAFLRSNDSYGFFSKLDAALRQIPYNHLITTGPTGTNVNDLVFILTYPQ